MKKFRLFLVISVIGTLVSLNAFSNPPKHEGQQKHGDRNRHHHRQNNQNPGSVGAPLDGGLLAVLGAAGVAYFVAKKKKNSIPE